MRKWLLVIGSLFAVACAWTWIGGNDPRVAFADFDDLGNIKVKDRIEVAHWYGPWKRRALHLICTSSDTYQFVLKSRLIPHHRDMIDTILPVKVPDPSTIRVGKPRFISNDKLDLLFKVERIGVIDTLVSSEIDNADARRFTSFFGSTPPEKVLVQTRVSDEFMSGTTTSTDLTAFQQRCLEPTTTGGA